MSPVLPSDRLKPSQSRPSQLLGALYRPLQSRLRHDAVRPARRSRSYSLTHFVTDGGSAGDVSGWAPRVRIGIGLVTAEVPPNSQRTPADEYSGTLRIAERAEQLGFDSLWTSEHHGVSDGYLPSQLVLLSAVAAVTDRMRL